MIKRALTGIAFALVATFAAAGLVLAALHIAAALVNAVHPV